MPSNSDELTSQHATAEQHGADFMDLLVGAPDALVAVDRAGVIRYINRRAQSLFDYERDDLVGRSIETLVPDSIRPAHPAHREAFFARPEIRRPEPDREVTTEPPAVVSPCLRGRRRDGTEFPVTLSLSRVDTDDGPLVIAAVCDLTDRENTKDMRDWMNRLAAMVEFSKAANVHIRPDDIVTSWNPAAERP